MKKIINFLKSETLVFLTLIFVLIAQVIHTMYIFESIRVADLSFQLGSDKVPILNWIHALIFAVSVEAAILMFILNGKRLPSKLYAVAAFSTNILYYGSWDIALPSMIASIIVSSMLAGSIWFFSDLFAEKVELLPYGQSSDSIKNYISVREQEERAKIAF